MLIVIRMENSFSNRFFDDLGQLRRKYVSEIFIGIGDLNRGINFNREFNCRSI